MTAFTEINYANLEAVFQEHEEAILIFQVAGCQAGVALGQAQVKALLDDIEVHNTGCGSIEAEEAEVMFISCELETELDDVPTLYIAVEPISAREVINA